MMLPLLVAALLQVPVTAPDTAVLTVGNRTVFVFRARIGLAEPRDRAASALRRIQDALEIRAGRVTVTPDLLGRRLELDGKPLFRITAADVDTAAGVSLDAAASATAQSLQQAVTEYSEAHTLRTLLLEGAQAAGATLLLLLGIRLLRSLRRRIHDWILAHLIRSKLVVRSMVASSEVTRWEGYLMRLATLVIGGVVLYLYLTFVLTRFPFTRPWGEAFGKFLIGTLARIGLGMLHSLPDLVSIAIILIIARLAINWLRSLFDAIAVGRLSLPGVHPETAPATRRIVIVMVWLFAGAAIYPHLPGSGTDAFKGLSVLAGVLVTFGSSGIVGQAMSGLLLIYTRGFRVGDFIKVGDVEGTVVELGMLATRVRTVRNEYVSIPNNVVVSGSVTGYSTAGREQKALFASATVTIGYDSPWRQIHELLIRAAQRTDGCVAEPAPFVLQKGLNDWYVAYELNAPVDPARATELPYIRARLNENIQDSFWEAGVEIMSPSYFALRDGNTVTIPPEHRPPNPPGAFRVSVEPK